MNLRRILKVFAVVMATFAAGAPVAGPVSLPAPELQVRIDDARLPELSGLAPSRRQAGLWWALNDSGNAPELIAFDSQGRIQGGVRVSGVINHDWEDLASFEDDQGRWLLIGDIGNNFGLRSEVSLILLREPRPDAGSVAPHRVLRFTWADGARDSESLAVDVAARQVLLADKGRRPVGLYALSLDDPGPLAEAQRLADLPDLSHGPPPHALSVAAGRWRGTPTAMDLDASGRRLLLLTGASLSLFRRDAGQDWRAVVRVAPTLQVALGPIGAHHRGAFEAAAFDVSGNHVWFGHEGRPAWLYRWTPGSDQTRH